MHTDHHDSDGITPSGDDSLLRDSPVAGPLWSMPVPFVLSLPETGEIQAVNPAFEEVTGYSAAELVGESTYAIGLFPAPARRTEIVAMTAAGGSVDRQEIEIRTKGGEILTILASCRRFRLQQRELLCTLFMDVTTRNRMERALRESEIRYRRLFYEGTEPAMVLELLPGTAFGCPIEVNDRMVELLERPRAELLSMTPVQWETTDNPETLEQLRAALDSSGQIATERTATTSSGRRLILELRLRLLRWQERRYVLATVRDLTAQREAETALRLNEASLRVALTAARIRLFRTDRDLHVTWSYDPAHGAIAGLADRDGRLRPAVVSHRSRIGQALRDVVRTGETLRLDVNLRRGARVEPHEMVMEPAREPGGSVIGVVVAVLDIAERKAAELQLREAARQFELLTEAAPIGILRFDVDGRVTHANPAAKEIAGRTFADTVSFASLAMAEERDAAAAAWHAVCRGMQGLNENRRIQLPDGETRWVWWQMTPVFADHSIQQVIAAVADVTEAHQLTAMLRALVEARLTSGSYLFEALLRIVRVLGAEVGCIVVRDGTTGVRRPLAFWPEAQVDAFAGVDGDELFGPREVVVAVELAAAAPRAAATWAADCESAICLPLPIGGRPHDAHLCLCWRRPLRDAGRLRRLAELATLPLAAEIERGTEERAKRHIEKQLLQSQKFEALGALASGIAHDFNNVLTAVLNFVELARTAGSPAESREHLDQISTAARRAADLVRQILQFRRQPLAERDDERAALDLPHLVTDALRFLRPAIYSSIRVDYAAHPDTPCVLGDRTRIHQVIMNLFINAAQAIGDRVGSIRLELGAMELIPPASSADPSPCRYARMTVSDTGPGIAPDVLPHVFEPFFTTKADRGGSGLGLCLVRQIVEEHGGSVTVESRPGAGTAFTVLLPALDVPAPVPVSTAAPGAARGAGEHILLVDDELPVLRACETMLRQCGFRVSGYSDPRQALADFWSEPAKFQAALVDFRMPGMDGIALAELLQRGGKRIPVALMSGFRSEIAPATAEACGAVEILEKPFGPAELSNTVARLLASG